MKATDFNLSKDIEFDINTGITSFHDNRLVIFDTNVIGLLRNSVLQALGKEKAKEIFLKFGFTHGYSDFMHLKVNYEFDSEMDLLAAGPVIHTWEGIVHAVPKEIKFDRKTGEFYFAGVWNNSYEAEQHLCYNDFDTESVCWSLMGYASGYCTAFFGKLLIALESKCMGKGDEHCEWCIQPPEVWGDAASEYVKVYSPLIAKVGQNG